MTNNFMTSKQVAEFFNVTPQTVNAWARSGALKSVQLGPKTRRFLLVDILDYLHERVIGEGNGQAVVEVVD